LRALARAAAILTAAAGLAAGLGGAVASYAYGSLTDGLPPVSELEAAIGSGSRAAYRPALLYDRTGRRAILELSHPRAAGRRWIPLGAAGEVRLPLTAVNAVLAAVEPDFWDKPQPDAVASLSVVLRALNGDRTSSDQWTVAERLALVWLLPPGDADRPPAVRALRTAIQADGLARSASKAQLLEWYLNTASFGDGVFGLDAAALVYFAKHAESLTLAESAMLAALAANPELDPRLDPRASRRAQAAVLESMVRQRMISDQEARAALRQELTWAAGEAADAPNEALKEVVLGQLREAFGPFLVQRGGLRWITTLDADLQAQAECALLSHIARMTGGAADVVVETADGRPCAAAAGLPPLRPVDVGVDHGMEQGAVVVLDPRSGELLALVGPASRRREAGTAFIPFVYLTAFARGYTAGTMILDLPVDPSVEAAADLARYHGPIRMREAMANAYPAAAAQAAQLVGEENVLRAARQMGLDISPEGPAGDVGRGEVGVTLLELTYAMGVIANQGRMAGEPGAPGTEGPGSASVRPAVLLRLEDERGRTLVETTRAERAILSPGLAFVMAHALGDEALRARELDQGNPLEIGQPAAVAFGASDTGGLWTVGATSQRAIGVWVGGGGGGTPTGVSTLNGPAPIWHAVTKFAVAGLPPEGWDMPPGVSEVEVCNPSGLLATQYCPDVVREVYLHGTEPTHYDTLYRPFRINRETGHLATFFTPLPVVDELIYFVPPAGTEAWAQAIGLPRPPTTYDTLPEMGAMSPVARIEAPAAFDLVRGVVRVTGIASGAGLDAYRLQYGEGLNPTHWVQIGDDVSRPVESSGRLATWDTRLLNGLYILQLVVVGADGRVEMGAVPVTIDNLPPRVELILPEDGARYRWLVDDEIPLQAEVSDEVGVGRVEFYVGAQRVASLESPPFALRWPIAHLGSLPIYARAYDEAGNVSESLRVIVVVDR
jgi:membrane peptidoglycan carboxypeptidase